MRVVRIDVREAPGLPDGVAADGLDAPVAVIAGPNAAGKSTLARALRGALWPEEAAARMAAEVRFRTAAGEATAVLRWGRVTWNGTAPALPGPEAGRAARFGLPALLSAGEAEMAFARRIAIELAGGYDLEAALAAVPPLDSRRGTVQGTHEKAVREAGRLQRELRELAADEDRLPELEERLEAADDAASRARLAREAATFARVRERIARLRTEAAGLPPELDRLSGDEETRLRELQRDREEAREAVDETTREVARIGEALEATRLPGPSPAIGVLDSWKDRAGRLREAASLLASLRMELASAAARARDAAGGLFAGEPVPLDAAGIGELETALADREEAAAEVAAGEALARAWSAAAREADPEAVRRLREGALALRRWLAAAPGRIPLWPGWTLLTAGAVAAVAAITGTLPDDLLPAAASLLAAGAAWTAAGAVDRWRAAQDREEARQHADRLGVAPAAWEEGAVADAAGAAEAEASRIAAAVEAGSRAEEAREHEEAARRTLVSAREATARAAQAAGLDPSLPDLVLLDRARRMERWHEASAERAALEGKLAELEASSKAVLAELADFLRIHGAGEPGDAAGAVEAVNALERRVKELARLEESHREAATRLEREQKRLREAETRLAAFWEAVGLPAGDVAALRIRLQALGEHARIREALERARGELTGAEERIREGGGFERLGLAPETVEAAEAEAMANRLEKEASEADTLHEQIAAIRARIDTMKRGSSLEEARAEAAAAAEAVVRERDARMRRALVRLVLESAREAVAREHAPDVLRRASEWLRRFTRGAFELQVAADGALRARDTALDELRSPGELSDGTRVQLLLAVRLAALEALEGGADPIPVVLDEALSTADPGRFREIAATLGEVAAAGRQVIVLTADPAEPGRWREALAAAGLPEPVVTRIGRTARDGTLARAPEAAPPPPRPAPGEDVATWAERAGIPAPDPWQPVDAWAPAWLLADRHDAAYRLHEAGLKRVGAWRSVRGTAADPLDGTEAALLEARAALATAVLDAWRRGRGRPVTVADLEEAGALTPTFRDALLELVERHGRDPEAFVAAVRTLPRYRKREALEAHLRAGSVLPEDGTADPEAVTAAALEAAGPALQAAGIGRGEAARWVRSLLEALDETGPARRVPS